MTLTYTYYSVIQITDEDIRNYYINAITLLRFIIFCRIDSSNRPYVKVGYTTTNKVDIFSGELFEYTHRSINISNHAKGWPLLPTCSELVGAFPLAPSPEILWDPIQRVCGESIKKIEEETLGMPVNPFITPRSGKGDFSNMFKLIEHISNTVKLYPPTPLENAQMKCRLWGIMKFTGDTSHIVFSKIIE